MGIKDLLFITYRIMPFIMVSFLVISSLFTGELSGLLVLVGLLLTSMITIGISQMPFIKSRYHGDASEASAYTLLKQCNLITMDNQLLSYLPLSTHTIAYIFGYFIYVIVTNRLSQSNGGIIAILTILLAIDIVYNFKNCAGEFVFIPLIIGLLGGVTWGVIVGKKNQMIPKSEGSSKCSVTKGLYKCKIKKTGQVINS